MRKSQGFSVKLVERIPQRAEMEGEVKRGITDGGLLRRKEEMEPKFWCRVSP